MSYKPSVLEQLQLDIGARLQAHPYFADAGVAVFVMRPRFDANGNPTTAVMINNNINSILSGVGVAGINGKIGAAMMVELPVADVPHQDSPGPDLRFGYSVRVYENPLMNMGANGTNIGAEDLSLALLNLLHLWFIQRVGSALVAEKKPMIPNKDFLSKGLVVYDNYLSIRMALKGPAKTPMPGISGDSTSGINIYGPTGASVYYTLDGSYPWSGNPTAVLLNEPVISTEDNQIIVTENGFQLLTEAAIPAQPGTLVQAVAFSPNQQASDLAAKTIS